MADAWEKSEIEVDQLDKADIPPAGEDVAGRFVERIRNKAYKTWVRKSIG